jgi:hypothetical protein
VAVATASGDAAPAAPSDQNRPPRRRRNRRPNAARPPGAAEAGAPQGTRPDGDRRGGPGRGPREARGDGQRNDRPRDQDRRRDGPGRDGPGRDGPSRDGAPRRRDQRDGRPGRGRSDGPKRVERKLYSLDSIVDRGFEDVEEESGARRVHWAIVKRTVADQITRKPMSQNYVLQRDGVDSEFPSLGAARDAVNKKIVHPEKLTLSKAEHTAQKSGR